MKGRKLRSGNNEIKVWGTDLVVAPAVNAIIRIDRIFFVAGSGIGIALGNSNDGIVLTLPGTGLAYEVPGPLDQYTVEDWLSPGKSLQIQIDNPTGLYYLLDIKYSFVPA